MNDVYFENNEAQREGGTLCLLGYQNLSVSNVTFNHTNFSTSSMIYSSMNTPDDFI